ncbi:GSU2403 family nucleotidyltransferase fold protein [Acidocella sp.]|uniref:GSU2403 family nucleotidyltransferase fold protein n=1 Tax=Acidocella sp. TaxID=50710 RepID=UPI002629FC52|nr:GSU2403 family nucleotidyltransferase fold protein [Acidocella sp.]
MQRCFDDAFISDFPAEGRFVKAKRRGLGYWYFDQPDGAGGQKRKYVGPDADEEIRSRVEKFGRLKADVRTRRQLVSTLVRQAYFPTPLKTAGETIRALSDAGFFRLCGVLVGTVAMQVYTGILGRRFDSGTLQTMDADFAQFHGSDDASRKPMNRFFDHLIYQPVRGVVLRGAGIPVVNGGDKMCQMAA